MNSPRSSGSSSGLSSRSTLEKIIVAATLKSMHGGMGLAPLRSVRIGLRRGGPSDPASMRAWLGVGVGAGVGNMCAVECAGGAAVPPLQRGVCVTAAAVMETETREVGGSVQRGRGR
eukprot:scaffold25134_cov58-Phaeocystis_antarctica.AAC.4